MIALRGGDEMKKNQALIAAMAFSMIIGLSFLFVKITLSYQDQTLILAQRFLFAFLAVVVFLIIRPISLKVNKKEAVTIGTISLFYPITFFTTQILGLAQTTVTEAGIIQATAPAITVLLAALFLKEYVQKIQIWGIVLSISGVIFLQSMSSNGNYGFHLIGNLLIMASILATAIWQIMSRKATRTILPIQITVYIITIGCIIFNAIYFLNGGTLEIYVSSLTKGSYLTAILFLGVLSTFGTSLLSIFAVSKLPVIQVSVFNNLATLITILSGILILQEPFHYYHIIGGIIIIIGVFIVNNRK